jgi:hypothetical protein
MVTRCAGAESRYTCVGNLQRTRVSTLLKLNSKLGETHLPTRFLFLVFEVELGFSRICIIVSFGTFGTRSALNFPASPQPRLSAVRVLCPHVRALPPASGVPTGIRGIVSIRAALDPMRWRARKGRLRLRPYMSELVNDEQSPPGDPFVAPCRGSTFGTRFGRGGWLHAIRNATTHTREQLYKAKTLVLNNRYVYTNAMLRHKKTNTTPPPPMVNSPREWREHKHKNPGLLHGLLPRHWGAGGRDRNAGSRSAIGADATNPSTPIGRARTPWRLTRTVRPSPPHLSRTTPDGSRFGDWLAGANNLDFRKPHSTTTDPDAAHRTAAVTLPYLSRVLTSPRTYPDSTSTVPQSYLGRTIDTPQPYLTHTSLVPHSLLARAPAVPRSYLGPTPTVPLPHPCRNPAVPQPCVCRPPAVPLPYPCRTSFVPLLYLGRNPVLPLPYPCRTSTMNQLYFGRTPAVPRSYLGRTSAAPRPHPCRNPAVPHLYHRRTSAVPQPYLCGTVAIPLSCLCHTPAVALPHSPHTRAAPALYLRPAPLPPLGRRTSPPPRTEHPRAGADSWRYYLHMSPPLRGTSGVVRVVGRGSGRHTLPLDPLRTGAMPTSAIEETQPVPMEALPTPAASDPQPNPEPRDQDTPDPDRPPPGFEPNPPDPAGAGGGGGGGGLV